MNKKLVILAILLFSVSFTKIVFAQAECIPSNPSISISPVNQSGSGGTLIYAVYLKNNDNSYCNKTDFRLSCSSDYSNLNCVLVSSGGAEVPSMIDANIPPGYEWQRTVKVSSSSSLTPDSYPFKVTIDDGDLNKTVTKAARVTGYYIIQNPVTTCTDSDGGINYYVKGTVSVCTYNNLGGGCGIGTDFCIGNVLREGYCEGNESKTIDYTCPTNYVCKDGACSSDPFASPDWHYVITYKDQDPGWYCINITNQTRLKFEFRKVRSDYARCLWAVIDYDGPTIRAENCSPKSWGCYNSGGTLTPYKCWSFASCAADSGKLYRICSGSDSSFVVNLNSGTKKVCAYATSYPGDCPGKNCWQAKISETNEPPTPLPEENISIIEEYKTVNLGETFTVSAEATSPYKWELKNYDSNYLEQQTNVGGTCGVASGQTNPTCTYVFSFKTINNGKTTIELDKINSNDNSAAEIKYIYVTINPSETKIVYLNQPFELKEKESAEIIDYRNMIVTLDDLELLATCQVTTSTTVATGSATTPTSATGGGVGCAYEGWVATVSMRMSGGLVATSMRMYVGETKDTPFGVKIRFDRVVDSNTGVFTVYQETNEFNFYVKTDKYSYSPGESVRITAVLSGSPSVNFKDAVVVTTVTDPNGRQYEVKMESIGASASACTQSVTTGTYTCARINEYYFTGTYNIPSNAPKGVYKVMSTAITSAIKKNAETNFEVEETYLDYVDVSINPKEQHTVIGKEVSYEVTVTDKHPVPTCPIGPTGEIGCTRPTYTYYISVNGLPYNTKYQNVIGLPAGGGMSFTLMVFPSSTGTSEGVTTATTTTGTIEPTSTEERIVSIVTGGAIAITPITTEVQPIKEIMFKFTVQATLQDDTRITDSDKAILFVRFIETPKPPPFPETEKIDIELRNGWNLISAPGYGYFSSGSCSASSKPIAFIYLTDQKKYVSFDEAMRIMGSDKLKEYLSTHSFWVYSYESCKMTFDIEKYSTYSGLQLDQGWNLLGVTKDMIGETMSNIKGTCTFEKLYSWDADAQKWIARTENDLIDKMGYGGIVRAITSCNLKANIIQPPVLP